MTERKPVLCENCKYFTYRLDKTPLDLPGYFTHRWGCWINTLIPWKQAFEIAWQNNGNCLNYKRKWWRALLGLS